MSWTVIPENIKPIKVWKPNYIQKLLITWKILKDKRYKPMTAYLMDELCLYPFTEFNAEWKKRV